MCLKGSCFINKREDKAKIIEKFKVGDIIKDAVVKVIHHLDVFEVTTPEGTLDTLSPARNKLQ